jgi:hypothetical protein
MILFCVLLTWVIVVAMVLGWNARTWWYENREGR